MENKQTKNAKKKLFFFKIKTKTPEITTKEIK